MREVFKYLHTARDRCQTAAEEMHQANTRRVETRPRVAQSVAPCVPPATEGALTRC
jgi:hypothetical protein